MESLNASIKKSKSCTQRRSGKYGLKETFTRSNSLSAGYTGAVSSNKSEKVKLAHDLYGNSIPYLKNQNIIDCDSIDYISNFDNLSLGDQIVKYPKLQECYPDHNKSKTSSHLLRHYSLPSINYDVASNAESIQSDASSKDSTTSDFYISSFNHIIKKRKVSLCSSSCSNTTEINNPMKFSNNNNESSSFNESTINDCSSSLFVSKVENFSLIELANIIQTMFLKIFRMLVNLTICFLILFLLLFVVSFYIQYNIKTCTDANKVPIPLKSIRNNLTQYLIGQDSAISVISDSIERYNYRNFSLGLLWIVGSIGVGKSKSVRIIQNTLGNQIKLHSVYGTLLPSDIQLMQNIAVKLVNEFDSCRPNIVIYDEFDDEIIGIKFITMLLKFLKLERTLEVYGNYMKIFIIISGSYGHEVIIESYTEHLIFGGQRHNFNYKKLRDDFLNLFIFKELHFDDVNFAPFLPLEEEHLIKCIHQEISNFAEKKIGSSDIITSLDTKEFLKAKNLSLQYIYATVKIMSNSSPFDYKNIIMMSGCKRVHKTINLLLTKS